jgi:hypothetical protein
MGPDRRPGNRQGSRGPRQPGMRPGLAARPGRCSPISAAHSQPQAPAPGTSPRSRSTSPVTGTSACRPSTQPWPVVRGSQTGSYRGGGRDAGPARVPDRCPRDRCHRQVAPAHNPLPVKKITRRAIPPIWAAARSPAWLSPCHADRDVRGGVGSCGGVRSGVRRCRPGGITVALRYILAPFWQAAMSATADHCAALARWCPAVAILSRDTTWGSAVPDMEWALSGNGHAVGGWLGGEVGS